MMDEMQASVRRHLMMEGLRAFNRREFYEAHEYWEEVWNHADDPERRWVQGLIQLATGLHKLASRRPDVCDRLLTKALDKLHDAPPVVEEIDADGARRDARAIRDALARGESPDPGSVKLRKISA